jgi:hypothetical protein
MVEEYALDAEGILDERGRHLEAPAVSPGSSDVTGGHASADGSLSRVSAALAGIDAQLWSRHPVIAQLCRPQLTGMNCKILAKRLRYVHEFTFKF